MKCPGRVLGGKAMSKPEKKLVYVSHGPVHVGEVCVLVGWDLVGCPFSIGGPVWSSSL